MHKDTLDNALGKVHCVTNDLKTMKGVVGIIVRKIHSWRFLKNPIASLRGKIKGAVLQKYRDIRNEMCTNFDF